MAEDSSGDGRHPIEEQLAEELRPEVEAAEAVARPKATDKDFFHALGGWGALLDIGLPWIAFLVVYRLSGDDLRLALIVAVAVAGAVALLRLLRKQPLRNVVGGFIGVLISAYVANSSGRAEDVYVPGLLINAFYFVLYLISVLVRWPLLGLLFGLLTVVANASFSRQTWTEWRKDPAMVRGFSRATMVFVVLFGLRLAVQTPLYFLGELNALGIAKVVMGLPFYAVALWLAYVVLKASLPDESWAHARDAVTHMLHGNKTTHK